MTSATTKQAIHDAVFELTCDLIKRASVTPEDAGCQDVLAARLAALGFTIEAMDANGVRNLWATAGSGRDGPHLLLAGHTDVVPSGPVESWSSDPFTPSVRDGFLYGRGAADMKASLAAMIVALELRPLPANGTLSLLITSDEEGIATHGTRHAVEQLAQRGVKPDYCIVGEPSSSQALGDVVRCGRRGSINGHLVIKGVQGHVAYPADVINPIHRAAPALAALTAYEWDTGNEYYPATSLQISNIHAGTGATNVVPGELEVTFNLRFNTEQTAAGIRDRVDELLRPFNLDYTLQWQLSGDPFLTVKGFFTDAVTAAIRDETSLTTELSTSGGTSDGRFIAPWHNQASVDVVELGPRNATIHKIDERVALEELAPLALIYRRIIENVFVTVPE